MWKHVHFSISMNNQELEIEKFEIVFYEKSTIKWWHMYLMARLLIILRIFHLLNEFSRNIFHFKVRNHCYFIEQNFSLSFVKFFKAQIPRKNFYFSIEKRLLECRIIIQVVCTLHTIQLNYYLFSTTTQSIACNRQNISFFLFSCKIFL